MANPEVIELKKTQVNVVPALLSKSHLEYSYTEINIRCFQENLSLLVNHYKKDLQLSKNKKKIY